MRVSLPWPRRQSSRGEAEAVPENPVRREYNGRGRHADVKARAVKHIKNCDRLFDGHYSPGGAFVKPDKEFAYNSMRLLALELMDELFSE